MSERVTYLSVLELHRLDQACRPLAEAFGSPPYLVGSVNERPDFRDVDVRAILTDEEYDRLTVPEWSVLGIAVSAYLRDATGLPMDFQFQRMTEANERHPMKRAEVVHTHSDPIIGCTCAESQPVRMVRMRNPLGVRSIREFVGDGSPKGGAA